MFTGAAFAQVVARSGLSKGEVATLYGVTRPTVYAWLDGEHPRPNSPGERMAETITMALQNSITRKLLPLPALDRKVRAGKIEKMRAVLQNLKPASR